MNGKRTRNFPHAGYPFIAGFSCGRLELNVHDLLFLSTVLSFLLTACFLPIAMGALLLQGFPSTIPTPSSMPTPGFGQPSSPIPTQPPFLGRDLTLPSIPPALSMAYLRIGYACLVFVKSAFWWARFAGGVPLTTLCWLKLANACVGALLLLVAYIVEVILPAQAPIIDAATDGMSPFPSIVFLISC